MARLWASNIPDLHEHISRSQKLAWFHWGHELKEGISFFATALVAAGRPHQIHPDIEIFDSPGTTRYEEDSLDLEVYQSEVQKKMYDTG